VEKYKEMQKNDKLWSTAMAIQMGEARYRNGLNDSYKEGLEKGLEQGLEQGIEKGIEKGKEEGIKEGEKKILQILNKQIIIKYHEDAAAWLQTLTVKQLISISELLFACDTLEGLKQQIKDV
ncbi:hypothetical protein MKC73_14120, partial [[Clostridium] innocuum]|nr:hypothetical protein [[Clostridium] innocuum]